MSEAPLPPACQTALTALEADPLDVAPEVEAHLRVCPACREAQVHLLALEEAPLPPYFDAVPAGYFERLPARVVGKLQARKPAFRPGPWWMAAAAVLALGVGTAAFLAGRANRAPGMAEAAPLPQEATALRKAPIPFKDAHESLDKLQELSPEEMQALLERLERDTPAKSE